MNKNSRQIVELELDRENAKQPSQALLLFKNEGSCGYKLGASIPKNRIGKLLIEVIEINI